MMRIKDHPTERDAVVLDVPISFNSAMRNFAPAQFDKTHRGWVCLAEHVPSFVRWVERFHNERVIDERRGEWIPNAPRPLPIECASCQQPAALSNPPKICPSCGTSWSSITPRDIPHNTPQHLTACHACGTEQAGRFPFCGSCGARMSYVETPRPVVVDPGSRRGGEPVPVGVSMRETFPDTPRHAHTQEPRFPAQMGGRPVETVELPAEDDDPRETAWYDR